MAITNPNDKVSPLIETYYGDHNQQYIVSAGGLSKREYFAAMVLQGLLTDPDFSTGPKIAAETALRYADALIAELSKDATPNSEGE